MGGPALHVAYLTEGLAKRGYQTTLVAGTLARVSTRLIAVSPQVRDDLVALKVAKAEKFAVIRLGIELDERVDLGEALRAETRRVLGIAPDAFVVGWIGRMTSIKNTDVVLRAFAALRGRGVDALLCLVGDGPDRDGLERAAHELGVVRHCLFLRYPGN